MSNVLMGVIGVVLFIGLALAGALFLGARFRSSTYDSNASAIMNRMSQVAAASSMYALKTGGAIPSGAVSSSALIGRFMKMDAANPVYNGGSATLIDANGLSDGTAPAQMVVMSFKSFPGDQPMCEAIQRDAGQIAPSSPFDATNHPSLTPATMTGRAGCVVGSARYWSYMRL